MVPTATDWNRQVLRGVATYAHENGTWDFFIEPKGYDRRLRLPEGWNVDGLIVRPDQPRLVRLVREMKMPAVSVSWLGPAHDVIPKVVTSEEGCGKMAADHFLERGFRSFGYVGSFQHRDYKEQIGRSFIQSAEKANCAASVFSGTYEVATAVGRTVPRKQLTAWLHSLPRPAAVLVWDAEAGREVIAACSDGLRVPDDVAVLSAEHDPLVSEFAPVPLSSIDPAPVEIGYRAAKLLDRLMRGGKPPKNPIRVAPRTIQQRRSTDTFAIEDESVVEALRFIRENCDRPIQVRDVVRAVRVSRSTLEHRFAEHVGTTPADQIRRVRLDRARRLLFDTKLSIAEIAERCGYSYAPVFIRNFVAEYGVSPSKFRNSGQ